MCLITKQKVPHIADKDMVVYKLLNSNMNSVHMGFHYEFDLLYETIIMTKEYERPLDEDEVSYGPGFHSFTEPGFFAELAPDMLYTCIIPAGSYYYVGTMGKDDKIQLKSIVSNQIIIKSTYHVTTTISIDGQ